jgi:hypothetical protein
MLTISQFAQQRGDQSACKILVDMCSTQGVGLTALHGARLFKAFRAYILTLNWVVIDLSAAVEAVHCDQLAELGVAAFESVLACELGPGKELCFVAYDGTDVETAVCCVAQYSPSVGLMGNAGMIAIQARNAKVASDIERNLLGLSFTPLTGSVFGGGKVRMRRIDLPGGYAREMNQATDEAFEKENVREWFASYIDVYARSWFDSNATSSDVVAAQGGPRPQLFIFSPSARRRSASKPFAIVAMTQALSIELPSLCPSLIVTSAAVLVELKTALNDFAECGAHAAALRQSAKAESASAAILVEPAAWSDRARLGKAARLILSARCAATSRAQAKGQTPGAKVVRGTHRTLGWLPPDAAAHGAMNALYAHQTYRAKSSFTSLDRIAFINAVTEYVTALPLFEKWTPDQPLPGFILAFQHWNAIAKSFASKTGTTKKFDTAAGRQKLTKLWLKQWGAGTSGSIVPDVQTVPLLRNPRGLQSACVSCEKRGCWFCELCAEEGIVRSRSTICAPITGRQCGYNHYASWHKPSLYCFCNKPDRGKALVGCEVCAQWFHGACVGLSSDSLLWPVTWTCSKCKSGAEVHRV